MDSNSLRCIANCDPLLSKQVIGVFAADEIPKIVSSFPAAWIINTDRKTKPGKHWVTFYISSKRDGEFFDSYGRKPSFYSDRFHDFFINSGINLKYNGKQLQNNDSETCGYYCIYYLVNRCRGLQMGDIIHNFSNNHRTNDLFVYDVVREAFPYCT